MFPEVGFEFFCRYDGHVPPSFRRPSESWLGPGHSPVDMLTHTHNMPIGVLSEHHGFASGFLRGDIPASSWSGACHSTRTQQQARKLPQASLERRNEREREMVQGATINHLDGSKQNFSYQDSQTPVCVASDLSAIHLGFSHERLK